MSGDRQRSRAMRFFVLALSVSLIAVADTAYTASKDGDIEIGCMCALGVSGCNSEVVDELTGNQRHIWTQTASVKAALDNSTILISFATASAMSMGWARASVVRVSAKTILLSAFFEEGGRQVIVRRFRARQPFAVVHLDTREHLKNC